MIHIKVVLEDQFSGAKETKYFTRSVPTFDKMKKLVGTNFNQFDKVQGIHWNWKLISVEQAENSGLSVNAARTQTKSII